ncbi:MAG: phage tail protein [Oceanicaulis sp.]
MKTTMFKAGLAALALAGSATGAASAQEWLIGEIRTYAFNFCPYPSWVQANGQLLQISTNQALYALYGTQYGGNGTTNFAVPDLRGRMAVGSGTGNGLTPRMNGQMFGSPTNTMTIATMPAHSHAFNASSQGLQQATPENGALPTQPPQGTAYAVQGSSNVVMHPQSISVTGGAGGGAAPVSIEQPTLALTTCVAVTGLFPQRD